MFTTPSGQTGRDAYRFELAAIDNERRALDLRMSLLMDVIAVELPSTAHYDMPIPSSRFPDAVVTADVTTIRKQVHLARECNAANCEWVSDMLTRLMMH